jgi:hypothetical protein
MLAPRMAESPALPFCPTPHSSNGIVYTFSLLQSLHLSNHQDKTMKGGYCCVFLDRLDSTHGASELWRCLQAANTSSISVRVAFAS